MKKGLFLPAVLFVLISGLYIYFLCPDVFVGDSGEFITTSAVLGVAHSPGYPLYSVAGKACITILPLGGIAYRLNICSAVFASLGAVFFYFLLINLKLSRPAASAACLLLALNKEYFSNALNAEVFMLNSFFAVMLMSISFEAVKNSKTVFKLAYFYAAAYITALALGNHHTIVFLVPGILTAFYFSTQGVWANRNLLIKTFFVSVFFGFLGLSIYAFILIRAGIEPPLNWAAADTLGKLWRLFTRADYGSFSLSLGEKPDLGAANFFAQLFRYFKSLAGSFGAPVFVAGLFGWALWGLNPACGAGIANRCEEDVLVSKKLFLAGLVFFIFTGPVFFIIGNMPFDAQSQGILGRFYILSAVIFAIGLGLAADFLLRLKAAAGLIVLPVLILLSIAGACKYSLRSSFHAYDYAKNILKTLPRNSMFFIDGGDDTFYTVAYAVYARGQRSDIDVHDRGALVFKNIYGSDFRRLSKEDKQSRRVDVESRLMENKERLIYSTMNRDILPGRTMSARGFLMEAQEYAAADDVMWNFYSLRGIYEPNASENYYRLRALLPYYSFMRGYALLPASDYTLQPIRHFKKAFDTAPDADWLKGNIIFELLKKAYQLYSKGEYEGAEQLYKHTLYFDPNESGALVNLGAIAEYKNEFEAAKNYYNSAIAADYLNADAHYNLAVLHWKNQDWPAVIKQFEIVQSLKPSYRDADKFLEKARYEFSKSGR